MPHRAETERVDEKPKRDEHLARRSHEPVRGHHADPVRSAWITYVSYRLAYNHKERNTLSGDEGRGTVRRIELDIQSH